MLSKVKCIALHGLQATEVNVEVSVNRGIPSFEIVGLPNKSIEESKHRIKSAFLNTGFEFADSRITVNLAPAEVSKSGSSYDLAIAVGVFCAKNKINISPELFFLGELSLDGKVHFARGTYLALDYITEVNGCVFVSKDFVPYLNDFKGTKVYAVSSLLDVFNHVSGKNPLEPFKLVSAKTVTASEGTSLSELHDIIGQVSAKRALEIAAAGGHNLMMVGSPGTGKSMLARAITSLLPPLQQHELKEIKRIKSYLGEDLETTTRPFRAPHHTISYAGMLGGGVDPLPGEVTRAHKGILFMDEFAEFARNVLEALRQPMQDRKSIITRNNQSYTFPCEFSLIAASNPCPCGYFGHKVKACVCSEQKISTYTKKLSGPIADRFDLYVSVYPEEKFTSYVRNRTDELSDTLVITTRVLLAQKRQLSRLLKYGKDKNAHMTNNEIALESQLKSECRKVLDSAYKAFNLTPRAYFKVVKVAQTIADLENSDEILPDHVLEALQYRQRTG